MAMSLSFVCLQRAATGTGRQYCWHQLLDFSAAVDDNVLVICSALDNLVKGASGQAVQNLSLMFGLPATTGLLQPSYS